MLLFPRYRRARRFDAAQGKKKLLMRIWLPVAYESCLMI
jgi:hypothetical protein